MTDKSKYSGSSVATFAGGCFWCMVQPFDKLDGVLDVLVGYIGGNIENPTYKQVCQGNTGHYEGVQIIFNEKIISYEKLLEVFWRQIDPTDSNGQFVDKGSQYKTAIFYHNELHKQQAEASKRNLEMLGIFKGNIKTEILPTQVFYLAEEYHQDFYLKDPSHYKNYQKGSGRVELLTKLWGDLEKKYNVPTHEELKQTLTDIQYHVTQENATEKPFDNEYWDNRENGLYVDIVSGEPLFTSIDKFDSACGWPSFTKPLNDQKIRRKPDLSYNKIRMEVRTKNSDSHLGHVFNDGPKPEGLRYCINSASLRFIPLEKLEEEGYGKYKDLFI